MTTALPATPAGLAVARRGSSNPVVSGRNCVGDGGGRRRTVVDSGGQQRTAAKGCRQWRTVLKCCLTVLGSSETRLNELGQPRTAAMTNGDQPRTAVTDQMRQKPERDRPAVIPT